MRVPGIIQTCALRSFSGENRIAVPGINLLSAVVVLVGVSLAVTRRKWMSSGGTIFLLAAIVLSSWIKQSLQGMALTLGDVHVFLLHPARNFDVFINYPWILATAGGLVAGTIAVLVAGLRLERPMRMGSRARVIVAVTTGVVATLGFTTLGSSQAASPHGDAYITWLSLTEMQRPEGWIGRLNVFFENRDTDATLPPRRVQTRFKNSVQAPAGERPDIFIAFEESTFDPTVIARCTFPECDSAMLHPLPSAARSQEGALLTHTTGGGSWLTEFAFLSGLDWRVFGRGGRFAPISLAPRLRTSLPRTLRALGYRTIAIYPVDGDFLGAETAYRLYGFEEFYSARDLQLPQEWFKVRDSLIFEKALAAATRVSDGRPVFVFALTTRNHGPWRDDEKSIPEEFRAVGHGLNSTRPRVIGWFGDHEPEVAWGYLTKTGDLNPTRLSFTPTTDQLRYITRYQISSNRNAAAPLTRAMDIAYLGAELLAFAGLPLDDGSMAARDVMERCTGFLLDCADNELIQDYLSYRIHDLKAVE
jgi:hypothetical protein